VVPRQYRKHVPAGFAVLDGEAEGGAVHEDGEVQFGQPALCIDGGDGEDDEGWERVWGREVTEFCGGGCGGLGLGAGVGGFRWIAGSWLWWCRYWCVADDLRQPTSTALNTHQAQAVVPKVRVLWEWVGDARRNEAVRSTRPASFG